MSDEHMNILFKKTLQKTDSGYTILEALIALAIIVVGVFSVLTLVVSNLNTTAQALDHLVAVNLAREGIELVRNRRDTNWYQGNNFDNGLTGGTYTAVIDYNDPGFTFVADNIDASACQLKLSTGTGIYTRDTGVATNYYRLIYLNNICQNIAASPIVPGNEKVKINGAICDVGYERIGIDIISKVKWTTKGVSKTIELNDRIYNWR